MKVKITRNQIIALRSRSEFVEGTNNYTMYQTKVSFKSHKGNDYTFIGWANPKYAITEDSYIDGDYIYNDTNEGSYRFRVTKEIKIAMGL